MLNRLQFELDERKRHEQEILDLNKQKKTMIEKINTEKTNLKVFKKTLKGLVQASQPLQEIMQMPVTKTHALHDAVRNLPTPLYILYNTIMAYKEDFGNMFQASLMYNRSKCICGN